MISEIFKALLITSIAGSVLAVIISMFRPITKKIFGYSWHYYIWLCVLLVMMLPVRLNINSMPIQNTETQTVRTEQTAVGKQTETAENIVQTNMSQKTHILQKANVIWDRISYNRTNILAHFWFIGAIALILLNAARYIRLNVKIRKHGKTISCSEIGEYTDRKINVRIWENIASPFMTGIFKPTLVLPKTELSSIQLHNILRHEMTHFKRHDILYKWFAEFVKCVHWFNPVVWYVARQVAAECEISCDMAVTNNMSDSEKMSYINTILSLLPKDKSNRLPLTTQMASSKKILKRRFIMIKNKKTTSKFMSVLSGIIAFVMLSATVFASGTASSAVLSDVIGGADSATGIYVSNEYTIDIFNNGEKIELANKPFIENGEVYVPLRETFEKAGVLNNPQSYIEWQNGKIKICLAYDENILHYYHIEIGNSEMYFEQGEYFTKTPISFNAPILRKSLTYISYSMIDYMLRRDWLIDYKMFDKDGNIIDMRSTPEFDSDSATVIKTSQYDNKSPEYTIDQFFYLFERGDFGNMKRYCTQNCIDNFFGDNYVFGMKKASLQNIRISISTIDDSTSKNFTDGMWAALVNVTMTPDENSVYDPNQTDATFYVILKQQDGRYLIDEFATGL